MADSSSETGSAPKTETELESNEDQDAVTEVEAGQKSDAEDDANSQAESEDPGETPPPPPPATPPRPNILMICLPSLSTEFPVLHTNTNLETFTKICTFPLKPGRILGEKGSVENVDDIVVELLEFIMKTSEDINVELFDLSIIFTGSDLGGVFVKKALVRAATDIKYRFIFTRTSLLFFFGTPHHASEVSSWEETLLRIAEDAYRGLRGPWFLDRIHQLSRYLEQLRLEFDEISDHFNIINYFQDMPESSTELLTVHKSCTELPRFNVTNIGVNVTHYELHCFISETAGEDFIVDRVSDTLMYEDEDFRQLVQWLSLESDGIETNFQIPGSLHNLANYIVHSVELEDSICNGEAQVISLEFEIEVDGRDFLSCLRDEIRRVLPPYPGTVIACTSMASTHSSSLTETGLLSSCIVQLLKQRPRLCGWLKVIKERVIYALRTQNTELRVRTLWECLRLIFARSSHFQGFWLLHTTGSQDQHELILRILKNLQYFDELDEISWKVIIVNNSASNINSLSSKSFSRVKLGYDTLGSSIERDVEARLDSIIQTRSITPSFKEKALRLFRNQPLNHKLLAFFMDTLQAVHPPIPEVLTDLTDSFSSINLAFHAILDRVPKHYQAWARKILGFLCFSWRPLSLDELGILIAAVDCKSLEQVRDNIGDSIGEHAQEVLPGIIRVTPENTFIIHDDFKSFLQQSPADAWYHPGDFHLEIATTSYNYLSFLLDQLVDVEPPRIESIVKWMLHARARPGNVRKTYFEFRVLGEDQYSEFVSYAARYWYDHLLHINDSAAAVGLSRSWLSNPDRLKEIIALRYHSMCQFGREFCAPKEFMPASVREAFNMSELEALKLTIQLIDRQASDKYIGIMYPPDSATNQVVRNWISLNLPPLSVPEIIACHPKEIERLFQHEEKAIRENLPDVLVSVVANNDRSLLVNFLEKVGEVGELAAKVLSYAIGWNMEDMAKALFEYLGIAQKGFWFKFDILEALSAAIATGNENMVKLLLDSGANINSQGKMRFIDTDSSPLIIASNFGLTNIVQLLLDRGAKVDLASQHGLTALHVASVRGFPSITKLLIDNRATIKLDSLQRSALHNAARYSSITRFKKIASLIVQALKDRWPRYEESGTQDAEEMLKITSARSGKKLKTALIYAAVAGDVSLVESLIDLGSDVDAVEVDGHTTLCRVGMVNDGVMTRFLIDNGAKVDYSRKDGRQPLHDACAWGASNSIEVLLEKNAVADHRDNDKIPPIAVAATWGIVRGIKQMIPHSSKDSISRALINAARYGYHEIVTALLDAGADINHQDDFGNTPLQFSCWNSNSRVTQMLLARMPDVNLPDTDKFTATVDAARRGHYECLKLLLDAGADMEAEAASGKRACEYTLVAFFTSP
ncbi:hypothetical protein F4805DRAFT_75191 [Annulohypoxylon moriforme]|nr:hypothetical protein F4805DRAFT_75191 [Annulohypoxylon moriforme]